MWGSLRAEALLRWLHPEKGLIPPLDFLPFLEGTELECEIGEWVIDQALNQIANWLEQGISLEVSINIASYHLQQNNFIKQLDIALHRYPTVSSNQLQLEILESSILSDLQHIRTTIQDCKMTLGVSFALDDFGTGYSSLTHLRSLSADIIKIDQTFVQDLIDDPNDYAIVNSVIALSDVFQHDLIAEGVETIDHGLMLILMGCTKAQGYGIAKPMPATDIPDWIKQFQPNPKWQALANTATTEEEKKYKLLQITTQHWFNQLRKNIFSEPEHKKFWHVSTSHHCHCGAWLKQARKDKLLPETMLKQLAAHHDQLHVYADELYLIYESGDIQTARNRLHKAEETYQQLNQLIQQL